MSIHLDQIVPWGRSFKEYELMFRLTAKDLCGGVLDCGGGPASFTAAASERGYRVVSADPIYAYSGPEIRGQFEATADSMLSQVLATPDDWTWSYHRDPEHLLANRRAALERFLRDYEHGLREGRYVSAELPSLPFASDSFGLAVARICSFFIQICSPWTFTFAPCESCAE